MPAYVVEVYRCPDRANAEQVKANFDPGDFSVTEYDTEIHDTPPVVLAGWTEGGAVFTDRAWQALKPQTLCIAADGRVCRNFSQFKKAKARGALPITWYTYPEAP